MADKEEMRMKQNAPLFTRPPSPDKKYVLTLADIPEASPGPNAFARHAARSEKHRLESNAFYQQEVQRRRATPPTALHPALRPGPAVDSPLPSPQDPPRSTMSSPSPQEPNPARMTMWPGPFSHSDANSKEGLAPLKLVPSDASLAEPTRRGFLEERRELMQHERSGSTDDRIPVFVPTPKTSSVEFADPIETTYIRKGQRESAEELPSKTPKKSFLGRLKIGGNYRGSTSPAPNSPVGESPSASKMPVKAQAVLGKSPPKGQREVTPSPSRISIPRSPSKRKHFFSRKASNPSLSTTSLHQSTEVEETTMPTSALTKTPPTAISDPSHFSYQDKRAVSQSNSDKGAEKVQGTNQCAVTRSQSLKYFDHGMPPTPPAKNTPPDQKKMKEASLSKMSSRVPFHNEQSIIPREPSGIVSTNDRISPTKFGSYGHKEAPTLVTRPSVYSLHASVVPSLTEPTTFEEMKARVDALGLEGFSTPSENRRYSKQEKIYSPSNYSIDWASRPESTFFKSSAAAKAQGGHAHETSIHTHGSSSSGGEIAIYYPELAKDPSVSNLGTIQSNCIKIPFTKRQHQPADKREMRQPQHGHTRSHDHSPNPRHSADASIFARYVGSSYNGPSYDSPTSFSHASAAPSPLQLQPTVYKPPPRMSSKIHLAQAEQRKSEPHLANTTNTTNGPGLGIHAHKRSNSASPSRSINIFDNAPSFPAETQAIRARTPSPQISIKDNQFGSDVDVDPRKISPMKTKSPSSDKLDRMIDILNTLQARNGEISSMRDEMRATNVRLGQRLAAVENLHSSIHGAVSESSSAEHSAAEYDKRVPTNVAYEFYRSTGAGSESDSGRGGTNSDTDMTDNDTIAELKEANRRLLEMVGGFADKIEALEKRVGGGT